MNEIWKTIEDYPDYMISSMGRVKSIERVDCYGRHRKEKIIKLNKNRDGYLIVHLYGIEREKHYSVHRLVAQAFIPNPDNKPNIDHINTDRTDNRVENLRWVTQKENCNNLLSIEKYSKNNAKANLGKFSKLNPNSKPVLQFTLDGKLIKKWDSAMDVKRELGNNQSHISNCCRGRRKTAYGYKWKYYYKGIWLKKHIPLKEKMVA